MSTASKKPERTSIRDEKSDVKRGVKRGSNILTRFLSRVGPGITYTADAPQTAPSSVCRTHGV